MIVVRVENEEENYVSNAYANLLPTMLDCGQGCEGVAYPKDMQSLGTSMIDKIHWISSKSLFLSGQDTLSIAAAHIFKIPSPPKGNPTCKIYFLFET